TARGIEALSLDDGSTLWEHPAPQTLDGWLAGEKSGLMYAERASAGKRETSVRLVWLDLQNGSPRARTLLRDWQRDDPELGPFAAFSNQIWTIGGAGGNDPQRELLELAPDGAADEPSDDTWRDRWLGAP
ncbi:MAG TPA: hypothetical protein VHY20_12140, partial [Pirellulales bacterium]|nr:hypothetical protein [Pirellulales bacterium]